MYLMWYPEGNECSLSGMLGHCVGEVPLMRWFKRDIWKAGIAIAGLLLLLVLMVWVPMSANASEGTSGLAETGTVQTTPTVDLTVTALAKEQLAQEVNQLQHQNERSLSGLFWNNAATVFSTAAILLAALFGIFRWWFGDRRAEREKRAEERFQAVAVGLGSKDIEAKVGSAIMLRTFLQPGYERFYRQVFDLAVAHLRLRKTNPTQSERPSAPTPSLIVVSRKPLPQEPNLPIDSLSQALISVFTISFPLARKQARKAVWKALLSSPHYTLQYALLGLLKLPKNSLLLVGIRTYWLPQRLDATNIQLDDAYLDKADLAEAELEQASLRRATLFAANLSEAYLAKADLRDAYLAKADLSGAHFWEADLRGADFRRANLSRTDIEEARSLKSADLREVKGLTKNQLKACKARGAIIDKDATVSPPQSPISPSAHPLS